MTYKSTVSYGTLRSIDSATFTGSYQALGTKLTRASIIIKFVNSSGVAVTLSTDGVNDMDILPPNSFVVYDLTTNAPNDSPFQFLATNTQFYVKGNASTGLVYLVNWAIVS